MSSASPHTAPAGATAMHSTTVREAMHPGIMACTPTATLAEVAHVMASCQVHSVSVVAAGAEGPPSIAGLLSDVDLLRWATSGTTHLPAGAIASEPAAWVGPDATVHEAAQAMADQGVTHLVVVDPGRHAPLGIISALDVAKVLAQPAAAAAASSSEGGSS